MEIVTDAKIGDGERCLLLRRRFKKTLADASVACGLHEHRLSEMERGLREVEPSYVQWLSGLIE